MLILLTSVEFTVAPVFGKTNQSDEKATAKIKHKITRFGVNAPVTVKLADDSKLNGRIGEIDKDSFVLSVGASGDEQVISYSDVQHVSKSVRSTGGANLGPAFIVFGVILLIKVLR